ncbi:MAG: IS4 family transposase, partial [Gemmatimonadota bacterium]|nr:IS4 family transposase [Gemmatimonadota bacterium]
LAIVKKELRLELSLYTILQVLSLALFEKMPILQVFAEANPQVGTIDSAIPLSLL